LDKYRDVVAALNLAQGKTAGGGGGGVLRLMCWIIFLAIGLGLLVGYMAVQDIKCNEALQPLVLKMQVCIYICIYIHTYSYACAYACKALPVVLKM